MNPRLQTALAAVLGGSTLLAACSTRTDVSVTGNTPTQYSHVWLTVQEVWFNGSATAGPDDGGWNKYPLSTPSTVDLVAQNGGNLGNIASGLRIPAATYSQVRLIPVDATAPLASSAQNAGALYNFEADYVDGSGITHQLPLELLSPDKGISIQSSLKVPLGSSGGLIPIGTSSTTTNTTFGSASSTGNPFGTTTGATGTTSPSVSTTSTTGSTSTTPTNTFAVALDGNSDLVQFNYSGGTAGVLLSSHDAAYDLAQAGGISGQLTLTNITSGTSGLPAISVSAQTLSADGTRHIIVSAAAVLSDGSFLLYPLATNSSANIPLTYDVVIHGPGIATIIVKGVQVPRSSSSTSTTTSSTTVTTPKTSVTVPSTSNTTTTGNTASGTSLATSNTNVNAVSIGTLTPRTMTMYNANMATAPGAPLPAGAIVGFYQTLGTQGEVPYVIESSPIDPFNQVLFNDAVLSTGTVDAGTWSTNGTVSIVSAAPKEGVGKYLVAASAPGFNDGALSVSVSAPKSGTASVVVPALSLETGASPGSLLARVVPAVANKYDQGELLLSHNGTLMAAASLAAVIGQGAGGTITVSNLPSGTPDAVYYATVRAWCTGKTPCSASASAVQRQWYPQVIDLRTSTSGTIDLTVN